MNIVYVEEIPQAAIAYKKIDHEMDSDYMFIRSSHSAKDAGLCPRPERLRQLKALQKKKIIPFKGKITHHYDDPKWTFGYLEEYLSYKMAYLRVHGPQSGVSQC